MKKRDSLEQFVNDNRAAFDAETPPEDTWSKIEPALPKGPNNYFFKSVSFWRAAAVFLFGVAIYLLATRDYSKPAKQDVAELQGFKDVEIYYSGQINEKMDLVHRYQTQTGLTEDEVTQNLKKLEAMYLVLKDQMKRRPTQDVRDALVLNFLVRLDLINQQLNKLDKPSAQKSSKTPVSS